MNNKHSTTSEKFKLLEIVFIFLIILVMLVFVIGLKASRGAMQNSFTNVSSSYTNLVNERLFSYLGVLNGGKALFNASDSVTSDEWQDYMDTVNIREFLPNGIGFNAKITPEDVDLFVPESERPENYVNYYLKYYHPRIDTIGSSALYAGQNYNSIVRGLDNGISSIGISKKFNIDGEEKDVFMLFLPVYEDTDLIVTGDSGDDNILGYIFTYFDYEDIFLLNDDASVTSDLFNIEVYDKNIGQVIYSSYDDPRVIKEFTNTKDLKVLGNDWEIRYSSNNEFRNSQLNGMGFWIIVAFLGISALSIFAIWLYTLKNKSSNIASEMTLNYEKSQRQLKRKNKDLLRSYNKLRELDDMKDHFISMVSHELRTPLSVINGYISLFQKGKLGEIDEKQGEYFNRISVNVEYLLRIINDTLDLSKLEFGKIDYEYKKINLTNHIKGIIDTFDEKTKENENNLEFIGPEISNFKGDEMRIKQIMNNLIGNALKFTEKGTVVIFLKEESDHVTIGVRDNGIGIKEENFKKIFQKFCQLDPDFKRENKGTGLGLCISKLLAEGMGGKLTFESQYNSGTTFTLSLPKKLK